PLINIGGAEAAADTPPPPPQPQPSFAAEMPAGGDAIGLDSPPPAEAVLIAPPGPICGVLLLMLFLLLLASP
ncbi:MAG: hypothetical protein K2Q23_02995, partial [Bryobacteraceae bacterium]|nr:hypothetical protein [Bryobacteraceae bacterium]